MDPLSQILQMIRLQACVYFRADFGGSWGMRIEPGSFAQFHYVLRGSCYLQTATDDHPRLLSAGDVAVLPTGQGHSLMADTDSPLLPGRQVVAGILAGEPAFQATEPTATVVCGHFEFDRTMEHPFLRELPSLIHLTESDSGQSTWLEFTTHLIMSEVDSGRPGADAVVNRLAEVLFIRALREHTLNQERTAGFFAALADPQVSLALAAIHDQPGRSWTLAGLAATARMSRTAFALRFKRTTGITPMSYLTDWRMQTARRFLIDSDLPLRVVADRVGYRSDAAFTRAFKRFARQSPGAYRRQATGRV